MTLVSSDCSESQNIILYHITLWISLSYGKSGIYLLRILTVIGHERMIVF